MNSLLSLLKKRPIIFDGAMGTMIQAKCTAECNALLNITRPDLIESIHAAYFEAGSDIIATNTFGASSIALADYGLASRTREINLAAVKIARSVATKQSQGHPLPHPPPSRGRVGGGGARFIAGEIGPTSKLPTLGHIKFKDLFDSYKQQAAVLLDSKVDCISIATCQDILQAKAAISAVREMMGETGLDVPIFVSVTIEKNGTMLLGTDILAALATLEPYGPAAFGINCATGPEMMEEHLHALSKHSPFPIVCRPNAGIPENIGGNPAYPLLPEGFANQLTSFVEKYNVAIVGGCCGTTPEHIRALVPLLCKEGRGEVDLPHPTSPYKGEEMRSQVSSLFSAVSLDQEPRPFIVAEQTNVNGSKRFKGLLLKDDYDGMAGMAKEAARGAHALDICVAYSGRDEVTDIVEVATRIAKTVDAPVMIDSTNPNAIEAALEVLPGRCIINSINLEDGGKKAEGIIKLARRFGAGVVCLTIDEDGIARTSSKKLEIAKRLYDFALSKGLRRQDLLFDALTFTLASGDKSLCDAAIQTIEGVSRIKKGIKGAATILGVSNVSYGLSLQARRVVTGLFLDKALGAGLDAAIVNPSRILRLSQIKKDERKVATRLLENDDSHGDPLLALIEYYNRMSPIPLPSRERVRVRGDEALRQKILDGDKSDLASLLDKLCRKKKATEVINNILLPAMKDVGELFGKGNLPLPFVLQSAEVMRAAIDILAPKLREGERPKKGTIVIATVRGDVHDIGKNLVDIILSNNGFEVVNLGIRQPIGAVLEAAKKHNADAIGLSGLLVVSTEIMREDLEALKTQGISIPVLVGGAALTRKFTQTTLQTSYDGPVFYCEDAFAGLSAMERLTEKLTTKTLRHKEEK